MTEPWMQVGSQDVLLEVWVVPGASCTELAGVRGTALKVRVAAPPERGRANREIEALFGRLLRPARVEIVGGSTGRRKRLRIVGLAPGDVGRRLSLLSTMPGNVPRRREEKPWPGP